MVNALREAEKPVLDAELLAERVGVTARTVRNHSDELKARPDVASMKIGRATVYWYVGPPDDREPLTGEEVAEVLYGDEYGGHPAEGLPEPQDPAPPPRARAGDDVQTADGRLEESEAEKFDRRSTFGIRLGALLALIGMASRVLLLAFPESLTLSLLLAGGALGSLAAVYYGYYNAGLYLGELLSQTDRPRLRTRLKYLYNRGRGRPAQGAPGGQA